MHKIVSPWQDELEILRSIIIKTSLTSEIKWGMEIFTWNGKRVVGYLGFKNFFSLWFYNGVFLSDKYKALVNAQEGKTKALRQWRFTSSSEIDEEKILEYINEAIENEKAGRVWKPEKSGQLEIPELMHASFEQDHNLKSAFENLTPYKQKEYIEFLESAKREETKLSRLNKIKPIILSGLGLYDKYK
ncbi:MAG: YdeI/OmpD-associated family protein [Bacteroidales bacterium]|nr:YdeI/OmpD-associated family protein [Bacteroidales bacterium]